MNPIKKKKLRKKKAKERNKKNEKRIRKKSKEKKTNQKRRKQEEKPRKNRQTNLSLDQLDSHQFLFQEFPKHIFYFLYIMHDLRRGDL